MDWRIPEIDRPALLVSLVKSMLAAGTEQPLMRLIDHALSHGETYDLTDAHLAAIFALEPWLSRKLTEPHRAISGWLTECREALELRVAQVPEEPADFRRPADLSCDCADCRALSKFLADPDQAVGRFSVRKSRRQHLHHIIESNRCDLTHVTERRGSPQTLVCTKTTDSYNAACQIHARDQKNLTRIIALQKKIG